MSLRKFPQIEFIKDRNRFLLDICKDKKVLHLGCGDAIHFDDHNKIGRHLHLSLLKTTKLLYGIDLDKKIIDRLKNEYKVPNVFVDNVENLNFDTDEQFDIILAGELIEHLNNPGLFLDSVKKYMSKDTLFIITTPNIISLKVFLHSLFNNQRIHPDHTLGFTYSLLYTLFDRFDLEIIKWYSCPEIFDSKRNKVANLILNKFYSKLPRFADSLILFSKLKS